MRGKLTDLVPVRLEELQWNPSSAMKSLETYRSALDQEATRTIQWYYARRHAPAITARLVRWLAILTSVVGGLYPIWIRPLVPKTPDLSYPLLALAAALIAIDRFGGVSSAWMRYIVTAQAVTREQRLFRLDWSQMRANIQSTGEPASHAQLVPLFERLRAFATKHDELVESETRTWMAEFRSVLAELGRASKKDDVVPVSAPPAMAQLAATRSGTIELMVEGADHAEGDLIVGISGVKRPPTKGPKLRLDDVAPGSQKVVVEGKVNGFEAVWEAEVVVVPGNVVSATAKRRVA
jgi:hypothetical protein